MRFELGEGRSELFGLVTGSHCRKERHKEIESRTRDRTNGVMEKMRRNEPANKQTNKRKETPAQTVVFQSSFESQIAKAFVYVGIRMSHLENRSSFWSCI